MLLVMRKPAVYRATQFFASRKPWPYGIHQASTPMGIILPHLQTRNGWQIMSDGDWILEDVSSGAIYYATQREFNYEYQVMSGGPDEFSTEGEPERTEVRDGAPVAGVADGAAPQDEVQSTGLLRPVRCDGTASDVRSDVGTGEVKSLPEAGTGGDSGVQGTDRSYKTGVDLGRPRGLEDPFHRKPDTIIPQDPPADIRGRSWKHNAQKFDREQKELFESLGIKTDKDGVKTS
jgi:hypothetical protein